MRNVMLLAVSTLPHFASILPLYPHDMYDYKTAILVSSTISVVWHVYGEPLNIVAVLDYLAASQWSYFELKYGRENRQKIAALNFAMFVFNIFVLRSGSYPFYHSLWHLTNSAKCFYVATLISRSQPLRNLHPVGSPYPSGSFQHQALNTRSPSSQRSSSFPPSILDP